MFRRALDFQTQLYGFANALGGLVEGPRLRMASGYLRDRGYVIAFASRSMTTSNWRGIGSILAFHCRRLCAAAGGRWADVWAPARWKGVYGS